MSAFCSDCSKQIWSKRRVTERIATAQVRQIRSANSAATGSPGLGMGLWQYCLYCWGLTRRLPPFSYFLFFQCDRKLVKSLGIGRCGCARHKLTRGCNLRECNNIRFFHDIRVSRRIFQPRFGFFRNYQRLLVVFPFLLFLRTQSNFFIILRAIVVSPIS